MQGKGETPRAIMIVMIAVLAAFVFATAAGAVLLLDDSLQGGTSGVRAGGSFTNGGWQVNGQYESIFWHLPYPVYNGTVDYYIKGIYPQEGRTEMKDKTEFSHVYDYTYGNSDYDYNGYRNNPYKHYIRKIGVWDPANPDPKADKFELTWSTKYAGDEPDSDYTMSWDPNTTYHIVENWYPVGDATSNLDVYRDGVLQKRINLGGYYAPEGPSVRIGASTRRDPYSGAPIGGVYSYLKVYDNVTSLPAQPQITWPRTGQVSNSTSVRIMWAHTTFSKYEVHITTANDPNTNITWNSGTVTSAKNFCITAPLGNNQNYYAFVRLWNSAGWGPWSANGNLFNVNTSWVAPNNGVVTISGRSFYDNNAHFLGMGATYMSALRFCKYDRDRFRNDCAYLASKGVNYIRILSMVSWPGKEIAPIGMYNPDGVWVDGWSDYWQQFTDCIDIAYDYGLRTEVTVFAGAQECMPNEADRYTHLDGIIGHVNGRDHKVIFIEVANEYYQNGLTFDQCRAYGMYLNARIGRLIALSDSGGDISAMQALYNGTGVDIATKHFERDTSTFEGGWLPVRDCWSAVNVAGVPPVTSNEPIGPGSSVNTENDPVKLVSAACFAWTAGLPGYVYHSRAGTFAEKWFEDLPPSGGFGPAKSVMPPALASWTRNDGLEAAAPFTVFCNGVANQYWTSNPSATTGCHRNIGARKDDEFLCYCQGVLSGGVTLQAREVLTFTVYNPMTGAVVMGPITKQPGEQITLSSNPGAYIIKGTRTIVANCPSDSFTYPDGSLNNQGGWYGTASASQIDVVTGMARIWGGAGSYDAVKQCYCQGSGGIIPVIIKIYPGVGVDTMWSLWFDDTSGLNLGRWYGSATTARGRIGATSDVTATQTLPAGTWSTLQVNINPAANTTQFLFNGSDLGTLSHASQSAGDILGRIRFERVDNSVANGNAVYFDDLSTTTSDTTPPANVTNFVATPGDNQVSLSWTNPGSDFTGTKIMFKTTGYPTGPTDGTQAYDSNGTSTTHTGLTNGVTYYYKAFAHDGVPNYASGVQASAVPVDTVAPANVTGFTATPGDNQVSMSWTNPTGDFTGTKILFKTTGYPTSVTDGTSIYDSSGTSTTHTGLTNGVTYYYKAFAHDEVPNYASGVQASGSPVDTVAPGNVTGFTATAGDTQVILNWANPGGDFTGAKILFKTTGYPTSATDGTSIYDAAGTTTTHTGLTNGVTYYYKAFGHDEVPNYASGVQASAAPAAAGFLFQDTFDTYINGALVGQGGWTGTATSAHVEIVDGKVRVWGGSQSKYATRAMNCAGAPYLWVRMIAYPGTGTTTMWNVWINDTGGKNFARWYGSGTTARGRMGTSGTVTASQTLQGGGLWDSLVVKIDPNANTTQFYFNGADLGVYSHGTQPGNTIGEIKIERENNSGAAGNSMYLDDIRVSTY